MVLPIFLKFLSRLVPPPLRPKKMNEVEEDLVHKIPIAESQAVYREEPEVVEHVEQDEPQIVENVQGEESKVISGINIETEQEAVELPSDSPAEEFELPSNFFEKPKEPASITIPKEKFEFSVAEENTFHLHDGRKLRSIKDLHDSLTDMDDFVFYHHVSHDRNDFANWISEVIKEQDLAAAISNKQTKQDLKNLLMPKE